MTEAEPTQWSIAIPIRYADIDAQRHLNNVAYFTFMEHARVAFMQGLGLWAGTDFDEVGMILAETSCRYLAPAYLGETVTVAVWVSHVGNKSFHLEYRLEAGGRPIAAGRSVQVGYDYRRGCSIPLPEEWRAAFRVREQTPAGGQTPEAPFRRT